MNGSCIDDDYNEYEDDDDDILLQEKREWLLDQAVRGQARQRAASHLEAVLNRYKIQYVFRIEYKINKILHLQK